MSLALNNALLQVNATVLVGLFIFVSLNPLIFNNLSVEHEISFLTTARNLSTEVTQIELQNKEDFEFFLKQNLTALAKQVFTDMLNKQNMLIEQINRVNNIISQAENVPLQISDLEQKSNNLAANRTGYIITVLVMLPFIASILSSLYGKLKIARIFTIVGFLSIIAAFLALQHYIGQNLKAMNESINQKYLTYSALITKLDEIAYKNRLLSVEINAELNNLTSLIISEQRQK